MENDSYWGFKRNILKIDVVCFKLESPLQISIFILTELLIILIDNIL